MFGHWEIIAVVLVILLLFGGKRIPEMMRGLGKGVREFKTGIKGEDEQSNSDRKPDKLTDNEKSS